MNNIENHAGITLTSTKLQIVELNFENEKYHLANLDEAYFSEPLNFHKDKETKMAALVQAAYNELLIKKPLKCASVSFTLPFELFYTMQVPVDNTLLYQDLIEEFRWEFSVLYPFLNVNDLAIQYIEVEKNDFTPFNTAIVLALPRKYILFLQKFCLENNLQLRFIDNMHLASERALSLSDLFAKKGLILSVYFNNKFLSIIYSFDGKPVYLNVIPLNDAGEIPAHLLNEIKGKENFKINRNLIQSAFITGEDISITIIDSLTKALGISFTSFNPFEKIKPIQKLFENKYFTDKYRSFSPSAGIAYRLA
jgi:Tfp pilus assembly PilM family ATPase